MSTSSRQTANTVSGWEWPQTPPITSSSGASSSGASSSGASSSGGGGSDGDLAQCFARCFSNPDGVRVLAWLRAMTHERSLGPNASDSTLRHLEGQRFLVHALMALILRGRRAAAE